MSVKIPTCQNDITKQWLIEVLKFPKNATETEDNDVEVTELVTIKEKNGFLSGVAKAKVIINGQGKNLFVKVRRHSNQYSSPRIFSTYLHTPRVANGDADTDMF